ncbi:MAG: hypothetical protein K2H86_09550 [Muribaculaceae bacterium]|nr:hypothetical protein [Muribaculaceae bacterium]
MDESKREILIQKVYRQLAQRKIAARYSMSKECQILRQTINVLINPAPAADTDDTHTGDVLAEYGEYNEYVTQCLHEAQAEAEAELDARLEAEAAEREMMRLEAERQAGNPMSPVEDTIGPECFPAEPVDTSDDIDANTAGDPE